MTTKVFPLLTRTKRATVRLAEALPAKQHVLLPMFPITPILGFRLSLSCLSKTFFFRQFATYSAAGIAYRTLEEVARLNGEIGVEVERPRAFSSVKVRNHITPPWDSYDCYTVAKPQALEK